MKSTPRIDVDTELGGDGDRLKRDRLKLDGVRLLTGAANRRIFRESTEAIHCDER